MSNSPALTPCFSDECHRDFPCCFNKGAEDKEKASTPTPLIHGCHYFFCQSCCGRVHLIFLIIFLIAVVTFMVFLLGFEGRMVLAGPNILCIDGMIHLKGVLLTAAAAFYVIAIMTSFFYVCPYVGQLWCARCGFCIFSSFLLVGIVLPAIPVILSWSLQNYIFVGDFNGSLYYCPFTLSSVSSNPVLLSEDMANSSEFICEFWSSQRFCGSFQRPDYYLIPWINMGGTYGAYNCRSLYSDIPDPCSTYVNTFMLSGIIEFSCIPFFGFIFPVMYWVWFSSDPEKHLCVSFLCTDNREICACDICGCECLRSKETEPLIPN